MPHTESPLNFLVQKAHLSIPVPDGAGFDDGDVSDWIEPERLPEYSLRGRQASGEPIGGEGEYLIPGLADS